MDHTAPQKEREERGGREQVKRKGRRESLVDDHRKRKDNQRREGTKKREDERRRRERGKSAPFTIRHRRGRGRMLSEMMERGDLGALSLGLWGELEILVSLETRLTRDLVTSSEGGAGLASRRSGMGSRWTSQSSEGRRSVRRGG